MSRLRPKLTYSNVVATLALFVAVGGASAFAASQLGKNTVGAKQIKKNAVTTAKIKKNAVDTARIKNNSVNGAKVPDGSLTGADVKDQSLTGADIDQTSLNGVRAANVTRILINGDSSCSPTIPPPSGVTSIRVNKGICSITFPNPVTNCSATATIRYHHVGNEIILLQDRTAQVTEAAEKPNVLFVATLEIGTVFNLPFDLVLVC